MPCLLAAKGRKLASTRLWLWLLLAAAITALYTGLTIAFSNDPDTWTYPLATPQGQKTLFAVGIGAAGPLAAVLGAVGLTDEFHHRTATATFLATPQRGRVIAAKVVTYTLAGSGYGMTCLAVTAGIALPWLAADGIAISPTTNGIPATAAGVIASAAAFALIGVGLGALLGGQVATVADLLIYLFVLEPVVTRIPALHHWTIYLPGAADKALTQVALTNQQFLAPWQGGLVLAGYAALPATAGTLMTSRCDAT